jgi:hypothetical protein
VLYPTTTLVVLSSALFYGNGRHTTKRTGPDRIDHRPLCQLDRSKDAPEVGIALGSNINGDDVKEGDDLYIECHIRANPAFHKLQWTHNVSSSPIFFFCFVLFCFVFIKDVADLQIMYTVHTSGRQPTDTLVYWPGPGPGWLVGPGLALAAALRRVEL